MKGVKTMPALAPKRLFTVDEYYRMAQARILREDDRVELIEGEIVQMTPIGSNHAATVRLLNALFIRELSKSVIVSTQSPVHIDAFSEPEPDVALLKPLADHYRNSHPTPIDIFLVVEVSDTSQRYDRLTKIPLYGKSGIPEAWLIDLEKKVVEIYTNPYDEGYRDVKTVTPDDTLSPQAFPELRLRVGNILGMQT